MLRRPLCCLPCYLGVIASVALVPLSAPAAPALPTVPKTPAAPRVAKPAANAGTFQYKADKISLTPNGVRLDGHAQITSPQLEVRADAVAFDFKGNQITQVRADGNVNIKVNFAPKDGGPPTRIDSNSDRATLDPATRVLVLIGNVDGFYQQPGGAKTNFAGSQATMYQKDGLTYAKIKGPVKIVVPPEEKSDKGSAALGTVVITSRDAELDQKSGVFRLIGDARAVSTDGPNKFDVTAPEMVVSRGANNSISTLNTVGRTHVQIDLPPEPTASTPALTSGNAPGATPSTPTPGASTGAATASKFGKPTRVDVESDKATIDRATSTLTFEGNVTGFYFLAPAGSEPQRYDFAGTKAVIVNVPDAAATKDNPAGLKADITGAPNKPVEVQTPAFNLDMGG